MENAKTKFCPATWFSGFFALGALVHLVRLIKGFSLVVAGHAIPLAVSGWFALIAGILSIGLLIVSLKRPCEKGKEGTSGCCK